MSNRRKSPVVSDPVEPHRCSVDLRLNILKGVPYFADLSEAQIGDINRRFREIGFQPNEAVYFSSEAATHLYVVADGNVKLTHHTPEGQDVMLTILQQGDIFGSLSFLADDQHAETAVALTPACVLSIDAEEFRKVLRKYPEVSLRVIETVSARLRSAHERIRQLSVGSVEQRIANTLLKLAETLGVESKEGCLIELPLSRSDLAEMVGSTPETTSRVISRLQREGLLNSGRRWIAIADEQRLRKLISS